MHDIEKNILDYFKNIPNITAVILFGSYARGTANDDSDVDIAILFPKSCVPDPLTLIAWREDLSSLVKKEVDLVCLNTASPIIGMQVANDGKDILVKDSLEYAKYRMVLFLDYAELKELRAPMEENILKRKLYDQS